MLGWGYGGKGFCRRGGFRVGWAVGGRWLCLLRMCGGSGGGGAGG